ncbi:hypothetical protein BJX76DRAFT_337562 [Aspergillus varians]
MDAATADTEASIQCSVCATTFSHRSSLIRHLRKKCNRPQSQTTRRKACTKCVTDRTRCNLKRPSCSRCALRQVPCHYPYPTQDSSRSPSPEREEPSLSLQPDPSVLPEVPETLVPPESQSLGDPSSLFDALFSDPIPWDLTLPVDSNPFFLPQRRDSSALVFNSSGQKHSGGLLSPLVSPNPSVDDTAALVNHSMELIFRVLRAWPRMLAEEFQYPPLIHHSHHGDGMSLPLPLAKCFTLVKMWHGKCQGAEDMVHKLILKEIDNLLSTKFKNLDEASLLAVLQAVTIYTIILLFPSSGPHPAMPDVNIFRKVQDLINYTAHTGLFLQEEREQMRPTWAAWVHVTSKRRAMLSLYLIHWAYAVFHNVPPSFNCRDLGFMPAPAAKVLWHAQSEQEWNSLYIKWLARWDGQGYIQSEFDQIRPGIKMEPRAEKWLEETDEFGMVMMSIVNATDYRCSDLVPVAH